MSEPDFNLLIALDILLSEASVAGAARRLNLSTSAMSRTLSRLRDVTGDPILVRAGRNFILEMACQAAENVILDRRVFNFNDEQYAEFIDMLDAPVADDPAIEKLLARKPQWDV